MLVWWIAGGAVALLTGIGSLICWKSPKARRGLKRARAKTWRKVKGVTRSAWVANKQARAATARGQLRAKRAQQPHRMTFGHRRTDDDPTLTRRAARGAGRTAKAKASGLVAKVRLARMNKKASRPEKPKVLELVATKMASSPPRRTPPGGASQPAGDLRYTCNATTQDGTGCQNMQTVRSDGTRAGACWIPSHQRQVQKAG
ncbi:hypothetical protein [Actinopolymorpha alba]|uniref:hypothetical protein n=1 Tax=Actinopolymorpha alba TaxID=533267 RepID=UPI00036A8218|nr:hypothetical protein [Actinopolymorpha alba]